MKKNLFYFGLFLALFPLFITAAPLCDFIKKGELGDYVVYEKDKLYTLLLIKSITTDSLEIEEATCIKKQTDWKKWIAGRPKDCSSWTIYEIPFNGASIRSFSFSQNCWIDIKKEESFLLKLLNLDLLPSKNRRKIGPPPLEGADFRQFWNPPIVYEGSPLKTDTQFFESHWAEDSTPLSGLKVELFFMPGFPLPHWIEVDNGHLRSSLKAVDSGKNLFSPKPSLKTFSLHFCAHPAKTEEFLKLKLSSPINPSIWELFFIDEISKNIIPVGFDADGDLLLVAIKSIENHLSKEHSYLPLLRLKTERNFYIESRFPIIWK